VRNAHIALLLDASPSATEWWPLALAALFTFVAGLLLFYVSRYATRKDKQTDEDRRALKSELAGFGLKIESEREERRNDIAGEGRIRREQLASLGRDVGEIREEINYDYGRRDLPRPQWRKPPPRD
jgi:hypothetical protein